MAQRDLACRFGVPTTAAVPVVVYSLVSGNATITVEGNDFIVTMTQLTADRGSNDAGGDQFAGYVGTKSITGLSANTQYTYTCIQGSDTASGSFTYYRYTRHFLDQQTGQEV